MKKIILLLTLLSTFAHTSEIHSRDIMDPSYIKVMKTAENQYSFASCEESVCSWLGEKNSYSKEKILTVIEQLKKRSTIYYVSEGTVLTAATAGALLLATMLGWYALVEFPHHSTFQAILAGTGAVIVAFGVPTAGIAAASKVNVLNPTYPKKLANALQEVLSGRESAYIKVNEMSYIIKLLGIVLDEK